MKKAFFLMVLLILPLVFSQSETVQNTGNGCLLTAVNKREDSLLQIWNKFSLFVVTAHETRKTQLNAAWNLPTPAERRKAVKAASLKFKNDVKAAKKLMASERKLVWKTFRSEVMVCKKQGTVIDYWENEADDNLFPVYSGN